MLFLVLCDGKHWTANHHASNVEYDSFDHHEGATRSSSCSCVRRRGRAEPASKSRRYHVIGHSPS